MIEDVSKELTITSDTDEIEIEMVETAYSTDRYILSSHMNATMLF